MINNDFYSNMLLCNDFKLVIVLWTSERIWVKVDYLRMYLCHLRRPVKWSEDIKLSPWRLYCLCDVEMNTLEMSRDALSLSWLSGGCVPCSYLSICTSVYCTCLHFFHCNLTDGCILSPAHGNFTWILLMYMSCWCNSCKCKYYLLL